jgi:endonuclease/exonuclease/phosphatase (EEP) superfamily protein YafD
VPQHGNVDLAAVHPTRPFRGGTGWSSDQRHLRTAIQQTRPALVAGDFNAVDNHVAVRRLAADGYRSTTDSAGVGWQPTWPADRQFIPPVMPIDHILLAPGWAAATAHTVRVPGTDHLGVEATVGRVV